MFSTKDIANLKEIFHNQGNWHNHTSIVIELQNKDLTRDASAIQEYTNLISDTISLQEPGKCYLAKKDEEKSYSIFQMIENSCIAGDFSYENSFSNVEIFSANKLNLDEVLRITREFFDCSNLEVTTFQKVGS